MTEQLHQIMRKAVKLGNLAEIEGAALRAVLRNYLNVQFSAESEGN